MTAKRFNYTSEKIGQHWSIEISDNQTKQPFDVDYSEINDNYSQTRDNVKFIVELLNELNEENDKLRIKIRKLRLEKIHQNKENEQLQERNDRQAKQLDNLYRLIEKKDWRTLTDIMDDFKKAEEQLQRECGTYGDWE